MTQGCVLTLSQGHISNAKVTVHIYPKSLSGPVLLTRKLDLDNISNTYCPWSMSVLWPWPKVISLMSRSQCTHTQNMCAGHNSLLPCLILIIYQKIVSWTWLTVISPRSRSQFTHCKNLCPDHYLSWDTWRGMLRQTIVVHDLGVVDVGVFVTLGHVYCMFIGCVNPSR